MALVTERNKRIQKAIQAADDTRAVEIGVGTIRVVPDLLRTMFYSGDEQNAAAVIVADRNTWQAAGQQVQKTLDTARVETSEPIIFDDSDLHATSDYVNQLEARLKTIDATPIAVGSGTINDLTKLASHNVGRQYMVVGTAASMDGYTAFGASVIYDNSKQTMYCPAPRAVVADIDILAKAPPEMNAAGYGDLLAKIPAGADWILADALDIEPIHRPSWDVTQTGLHGWVSQPEKIKSGDPEAIADLTLGLVLTGFGMQSARSSRPASGAEHQFSHLWDMQHHRHEGRIPLHGFKVSIGLSASTFLYEHFFNTDIAALDIDALVERWPTWEQVSKQIEQIQTNDDLLAVARAECQAKYVDAATLRTRLEKLQAAWPELRPRLIKQLIPFEKTRAMLTAAGAPSHPAQIGIPVDRLRDSFAQAQQIRRRFTILDIATHLNRLSDWAVACVTVF